MVLTGSTSKFPSSNIFIHLERFVLKSFEAPKILLVCYLFLVTLGTGNCAMVGNWGYWNPHRTGK